MLRICEEFGLRLYSRQSTPLCSAGELVGSGLIDLSPIAVLTGIRSYSRSTLLADPGALPSCHGRKTDNIS